MRNLLFLISFALFTASPALAQHYRYELLSPIVSSNEQAVDIAPKDWILFLDLTSRNLCSVAYNRSSKLSYRLCDAGMSTALAINSHGQVAGNKESDGSHTAAVWSPERGVETLPFLKVSDTYSEALDINDSGEVIGFSGEFRPYTCAADDNYDNLPDLDSDGNPITSERSYLDSRAFAWKRGRGARIPRGIEANNLSMGIRLNDRGDIVAVKQRVPKPLPTNTTERPFLCKDLGADLGPMNLCKISPRGKAICFRETYRNEWTYRYLCVDPKSNPSPGQCLHQREIDINNRQETIVGPRLFRGRTAAYEAGMNFTGREDYGGSFSLSNDGAIAGRRSGSFLENPSEGAGIGLNCLAPMNRKMRGSTLTTGGIELSDTVIGGFNMAQELLFSSNILGDGRNQQILLASPLPRNDYGVYRDFCPGITTTLETKGAYNIQASIEVYSALDTYAGLTATLVLSDSYYDSDYTFHQCASFELQSVTLGANGAATTTLTQVDRRFDYLVKLPPAFAPQFGGVLAYTQEDDKQCDNP